MREIGRMFRTYCQVTHTSWPDHIKKIEYLLNMTTHCSTECTPHEEHFGLPIRSEIEKLVKFPVKRQIDHEYILTLARENMKKHFERRKKKQKTSTIELNVGDSVMLRVRHLSNAMDKVTKKFFDLYEGLYKISEKIGNNAFLLVNKDNCDKKISTYNRTNLRKYHTREKPNENL